MRTMIVTCLLLTALAVVAPVAEARPLPEVCETRSGEGYGSISCGPVCVWYSSSGNVYGCA